MIKLIVGSRGSGKTTQLIDQVNKAADLAKGNVVCVEKNMKLTYTIKHTVRLIDIDDYSISGFGELYGFFAGLLASDYDITDVFVDGILKVGGKDLDGLGVLLDRISDLIKKDDDDTNFVITVSTELANLPESVKKYLN